MSKDIEYIEVFNQLEQHLRKITRSEVNVSFVEMINNLRHDYIVRQYYEELKENA